MVRRVQSRRRIQAQTTGANAVRALQNKAMRGLPAAHDGRQEVSSTSTDQRGRTLINQHLLALVRGRLESASIESSGRQRASILQAVR